ncbi:MAG: GTPase ObgE [Treponema sp.]|nr:GTPase ObgE [Treponema sp.]
MIQFADEAVIRVVSGKGGNGCVSFRREKYIPNGGPNGGDGGKGGNIIFMVKHNLRTLAHMRFHPVFKAQNGGDGMGWNRYGKDGEDKIIPVPPGTIIKDAETLEVIHDFANEEDGTQFLFLKGGKGGWGNVHFKSSTNQAPRYAHPGKPGEERTLKVELSIMADVGLVGFPNAGKSSLLDFFTAARPKIAPYPFTTKVPNLGVLHAGDDADLIIADIPGIIEGASEGAGLGSRFLKHISRTAGLLFMIDCGDEKCLESYDLLLKELEGFGNGLTEKPRIVLCNKIDLEGAEENALKIKELIQKKDPDVKVIPVSVMARTNMNEARKEIITLVEKMGSLRAPGKNHKKEEKSSFLSGRSVDTDMEEQFPGSDSTGQSWI